MLFKRKNKVNEYPLQDKVAKGIAGFFIKVQIKFADSMNKRVSGISIKRMKFFLTLFCLFWGGLSVYFMANAVFGSKQPAIKVDQVKVLQHVNPHDDVEIKNQVDFETYLQIQDYKKYMDSTDQEIRPGLLDSMKVLEQIYLSQQKKEANEK